MSGGGSSNRQASAPPAQLQPVPQMSLPTGQWQGTGPTATMNPYTQEGMPDWMRPDASGQPGYVQGQPNWFGMPSWGRDAATGEQLQQADLMYQTPPAPAPQQPTSFPGADRVMGIQQLMRDKEDRMLRNRALRAARPDVYSGLE